MAGDCFDVHTHFVPEHFPAYAGSGAEVPWPSMIDAKPCHKTMLISGKTYRTLADGCWSASRRIEEMPSMGVTHQAISAMPELMSYWMDAAPADELLRYINDQIAGMVADAAGRLVGLGAVPLQDLDLALAELHRLMRDLGFAGVQIGSNVNGRPIGAPEFDPFFEAAEELGLTVETARNYSKKIYAKTDARGHADLVRVILSGVIALT